MKHFSCSFLFIIFMQFKPQDTIYVSRATELNVGKTSPQNGNVYRSVLRCVRNLNEGKKEKKKNRQEFLIKNLTRHFKCNKSLIFVIY